jgi:signal transduction histidine kinase
MLPHPTADPQVVLADTLARPRMVMTARERLAELVLGSGFLAALAALWVYVPPGRFAIIPALAAFLVLAVAARIQIDTSFGFTVPTQLAFVPLLFAMPLALVPIAVVAALLLARIPDLLRGQLQASRMVHAVANSWYAFGPVAVFALARVAPQSASAAVLLAALAGQFLVDYAAIVLRFKIAGRATPVELMSQGWIYVVDAGLSGVALVAAEQINRSPIAVLAPLPLLGLVAMFARERRQRLESLVELNDAYREARDAAVEALSMKSAFLRNVSHEIRTPMNAVMGMNELLLDTPLDGTQLAYAQRIQESGEQMLTIINDILDVSKLESGEFGRWRAGEEAALELSAVGC